MTSAFSPDTVRQVTLRRVLFLINSLEGGGAERVFSTLVNRVQPHLPGMEICVALLDDRPQRYNISSNVPLVCLNGSGGFLDSAIRYKRFLDEYRPDLVFSFLTRANYLAAAFARSYHYRCIISERSDTNNRLGNGLAGWAKRWLVKQLYPRAHGIIAVSGGVRQGLTNDYQVPPALTTVIHNPCDLANVRAMAEREGEALPAVASQKGYIVAVGRLVGIKRFDVLIRAYAAGRFRQPLVILGEGPELAELTSLAASLGVAERVFFPGFFKNPYPVMANASLYVLCSDAEGFPNSLVEAMALGRPVISTNCNGAAEILDGTVMPAIKAVHRAEFGMLVPTGNVRLLAGAMHQVLSDEALRATLAERALVRASQFSVQRAVEQYAAVITRQFEPAMSERG